MGQLLLHRPEGLGHILVLSDVQLQQLQARGAESGQATGPGAISPQTACKHCEASLVQAAGQFEAEATVAPCDQHAVAMAVLRGVLSAVPHRLDEEQQQQYGDSEAAHGLAHQEGAAHGGGLEDQRKGGLEDWMSYGLDDCRSRVQEDWRSVGLEEWRTDCLPAGLGTPPKYNTGREHQRACTACEDSLRPLVPPQMCVWKEEEEEEEVCPGVSGREFHRNHTVI